MQETTVRQLPRQNRPDPLLQPKMSPVLIATRNATGAKDTNKGDGTRNRESAIRAGHGDERRTEEKVKEENVVEAKGVGEERTRIRTRAQNETKTENATRTSARKTDNRVVKNVKGQTGNKEQTGDRRRTGKAAKTGDRRKTGKAAKTGN